MPVEGTSVPASGGAGGAPYGASGGAGAGGGVGGGAPYGAGGGSGVGLGGAGGAPWNAVPGTYVGRDLSGSGGIADPHSHRGTYVGGRVWSAGVYIRPVPAAGPAPVQLQLVRDFALDLTTGLVMVRNGDLVLTGDADAVRQGIAIRVRMILGEYYLDESVGVDWWYVFDKLADPLVVRELIREAIAGTPDVTEVIGSELQLDRATRAATISYQVRTVYSTEPIDGEVVLT